MRAEEKREERKIKVIEKIMKENPGLSVEEAYKELRHQQDIQVQKEMVFANKEMVKANKVLMWTSIVLVVITIIFSLYELLSL